METDRCRCILANFLIGLGLLLIIMNIMGFFLYTTIDVNNPHILGNKKKQISMQQFWHEAFEHKNENTKHYVDRLTSLVSSRMLYISDKYCKPTIFENWILWCYAQSLGGYEWIEERKAIRLGGGLCSEHAIVLERILREQNIDSRIIVVEGHVVNEVLIDKKWYVYDAVYNVKLNASLEYLEANPERVFIAYKNAGLSDDSARQFQRMFATVADNFQYRSSDYYAPGRITIERASFYLIWIVPILLILIGHFFGNCKIIRVPTGNSNNSKKLKFFF